LGWHGCASVRLKTSWRDGWICTWNGVPRQALERKRRVTAQLAAHLGRTKKACGVGSETCSTRSEEGYGRGTRMGNGREGAGYGRHCNRSFAILHEARSAQRALPGTAVDRLTPTPSYRSPYRTPYRSLNLF
jgi:hypothetical protein